MVVLLAVKMLTYDLELYCLAIELDGSDFLLSGISQATFQLLRVKCNGSTYEVDANSGDVGFGVGVVGESQQQARLSDSRVTDQEELEEVIISVMVDV